MKRSFPGALVLCGLLVATTAWGQSAPAPGEDPAAGGDIVASVPDAPPDGGYCIRQDEPDIGSNIRRCVFSGSPLPFDREWAELTPRQQAIFRQRYEKIPDDQEPPFPLGGLQRVYRPLSGLLEAYVKRGRNATQGRLDMAVVVGPDGWPQSIAVYETPDPDISNTLAAVLMEVRFKPAACQGKPCQMEFPVETVLRERLAGWSHW